MRCTLAYNLVTLVTLVNSINSVKSVYYHRTIHGSGKNLRTFLYVKDVAKAFDLILHKGKVDELYNIAGKSEVTVYEVAKKIWELLGNEGSVDDHIEYVRDREFNDFRYAIDGMKLEKLGWKAETTFDEGMEETGIFYSFFLIFSAMVFGKP